VVQDGARRPEPEAVLTVVETPSGLCGRASAKTGRQGRRAADAWASRSEPAWGGSMLGHPAATAAGGDLVDLHR